VAGGISEPDLSADPPFRAAAWRGLLPTLAVQDQDQEIRLVEESTSESRQSTISDEDGQFSDDYYDTLST